MIKVPHIYADWMDCLDSLRTREDDEAVLKAMNEGSLVWTSGIAERFINQFVEVIKERKEEMDKQFSAKISSPIFGSDQLLISSLLRLRKEYNFLLQVSQIPALPQEHRQGLADSLKKSFDETQKALEDSARRNDRSGMLLHIVKNHKVNQF